MKKFMTFYKITQYNDKNNVKENSCVILDVNELLSFPVVYVAPVVV